MKAVTKRSRKCPVAPPIGGTTTRRTYVVDTLGPLTLTEAMSYLQPGDTLFVRPGRYVGTTATRPAVRRRDGQP